MKKSDGLKILSLGIFLLGLGSLPFLSSCSTKPKPGILTFHYTLTNKAGEVLDSSQGKEPLTVVKGAGQIIPGLETELVKMAAGEKRRVEVPAASAYGPVQEDRFIKVKKDQLPSDEVKVGDQLSAGMGSGIVFVVKSIEGDEVTLDGNHPLAGQDLTFDVEVLSTT